MLAAHQTDAVERVLELLATRRGALLADDVGLGKSFIAAEVMRRFDRCDLIVPAALVEQWRETLRSFDVHANLVTHDGLVRDPFFPEARERVVVVDEAHAFRNPRTQRYAALARRTAGARVLLVTATPICNGVGDLEALVRVIARDDLLGDVGVPSIDVAFATRDRELIAAIVAALVIRRDRSALPAALQFGELERRVVRHPVLRANGIDELRFPLTCERAAESAMLRRFLWRRLESSEAAFIESLRRQRRFYERALAAIAAGRTLPKRDYRAAFAHEEDRDAFQEVLFWDLFAPRGEADPHAIREEIARIDALIQRARDAPETKRNLLFELLTGEPTLVFTGSAATARDLHQAIQGSGLVTSRERSRDAVLDAFRKGKVNVVISTDMSAEGLNLQRAGTVVHYDIPWNPVKLDQRNGRAHRIGQQRDTVKAIYFLPDTRETRIVETVARKNRVRKRALQPSQPGTRSSQPTLRPRVTKEAAITRLHVVAPETLLRRHKAGLEQLIDEMSREYLDQRRIDDLVALVELECGS
ncbi:MAG TPA: DEAD/DEAH box helicase [Thermoanaerobaculia bacterium]|jgi:superfamily II DNA or RNA helicase|nr:DEAD/DEAH box helicase [Thermoanaerobaculia bacterium]